MESDQAQDLCDRCFAPWEQAADRCSRCGAARQVEKKFLGALNEPRNQLFRPEFHEKWLSSMASLDPDKDPSRVRWELFNEGFSAGRGLVGAGHPNYLAELQPFWYTPQTAGQTFVAKVLEREVKFRNWNSETKLAVNDVMGRLLDQRYGSLDTREVAKAKFGPWHLANTLFLFIGLGMAGSSSTGVELVGTLIFLLALISWLALWEVRRKRRKHEREKRTSKRSQERPKIALRAKAQEILVEGLLLAFAVEQGHRDAISEDTRREKWAAFERRPEQVEKAQKRREEELIQSQIAVERIRQRQSHVRNSNPRAPRRVVDRVRKRAPASQASDFQSAEQLCARWLERRGEPLVRLTGAGADGGVDIESSRVVAQVKNFANPVGVQPVREIYGVAAAKGKTALFFSSGGFTKSAKDFAMQTGMALLIFDGQSGAIRGANSPGRILADS